MTPRLLTVTVRGPPPYDVETPRFDTFSRTPGNTLTRQRNPMTALHHQRDILQRGARLLLLGYPCPHPSRKSRLFYRSPQIPPLCHRLTSKKPMLIAAVRSHLRGPASLSATMHPASLLPAHPDTEKSLTFRRVHHLSRRFGQIEPTQSTS